MPLTSINKSKVTCRGANYGKRRRVLLHKAKKSNRPMPVTKSGTIQNGSI